MSAATGGQSICAIGRDAETSPSRRGVGQEGRPLLHPDGLGYALILRATDPKEHDELVFEHACRMGLEGIVSKRLRSFMEPSKRALKGTRKKSFIRSLLAKPLTDQARSNAGQLQG